jgi:hypothetical protein
MAEQSLSRELQPSEIPEDIGEHLPEAPAVSRRAPYSRAAVGGAEHRSGVQKADEVPSRAMEPAPIPEDPPRTR